MSKNLFYATLCLVFFCRCDMADSANKRQEALRIGTEVSGYKISIIEFDSCQYLISKVGYSQMMTHKGNCKYCSERAKKH